MTPCARCTIGIFISPKDEAAIFRSLVIHEKQSSLALSVRAYQFFPFVEAARELCRICNYEAWRSVRLQDVDTMYSDLVEICPATVLPCGREHWAERMTKENCSRKRNSQDAGIKREETRIREDFHAKEASFAGASCPLINCE